MDGIDYVHKAVEFPWGYAESFSATRRAYYRGGRKPEIRGKTVLGFGYDREANRRPYGRAAQNCQGVFAVRIVKEK